MRTTPRFVSAGALAAPLQCTLAPLLRIAEKEADIRSFFFDRDTARPHAIALAPAEAIALRPGSRGDIDAGIMATLRDAMLTYREVLIPYRARF